MNLVGAATTFLVFSVVAHGVAVAMIAIAELTGRSLTRPGRASVLAATVAVYGGAATVSSLLALAGDVPIALAMGLAVAIGTGALLRDFSRLGVLLLATHVQVMLSALGWGLWFIATMPVSSFTRALLLAGYPLLLLKLRAGLVHSFETAEILCRRRWRRPRDPLPLGAHSRQPRVAIHVPVCSEPPDMVIATLDALAELRYPDYEVLVVDNNTADPRLWKPVAEHCRRLGDRFRFFHEERLAGAKAGALNFALRHTSPEAEVVGVVDSDYLAEPDFLSRLMGHFDDPMMGFVQAPHDYRRWEHSRFLRMCYWEYKLFFHTTLPSLNERNAAYSVGTMCLFRRRALEEAGGWAEWCATEDSEIAIRVHALGYCSVYVRETFGRGLIPATFARYKQQRYRWTFGPVQELKHHFRLLLPRPLGRASALTATQKFYHLNHGLERSMIGLGVLFMPVGLTLAGSLAAHGEVVPVPGALWLTAAVLPATNVAVRTLLYRRVRGTVADGLGAMAATAALSHTVTMASMRGLLTRHITWRRTSKFASQPLGWRCIQSATPELGLGLAAILFGSLLIVLLPHLGLLLLLSVGLIIGGLSRLAAPALALLADRDARAARGSAPHHEPSVAGHPVPEPLVGGGRRLS